MKIPDDVARLIVVTDELGKLRTWPSCLFPAYGDRQDYDDAVAAFIADLKAVLLRALDREAPGGA